MKLPLFFLLVAATAVGCNSSSGPVLAPNVTAAQQRSACESMGFSFPLETQFLLYHRASDEPGLLPAPDDSVHLKVELPSAVAMKMLSEAPFASAKWQATVREVRDVPDWKVWKPSDVKKFRSAQIPLPNAQYLNVLVDEDREERTILYLMWFET